MSEPVELEQQEDFQFTIRFGDSIPALAADESPPLGKGAGPTPVQLLAAAVGNCLSDSLLFALRKFKQAPEPIRAVVDAGVGRNPQNRLRVERIGVRITLGVPASSLQHLDRALGQFEEFCTVAQSVRQGIDVDVEVYDSIGARLK
ncbi:MAG: OsmC family protein [Casimicrobiaceae bacterium]